MREISLKAYAKVNLSLDVLGKLPDGYHEVKMVMQLIDLWDPITVRCRERETRGETVISGGTSCGNLPMDESNIAYKAAKLMVDTYGPEQGCEIEILVDKHIPIAAGLAGGSADGAAVMRALAKLWDLNVPAEELASLSACIGADLPFCLMGQEGQTCALAEGIGERLTPVTPLPAWILLSKPPVSVPTKEVYGNLDLAQVENHPDVDRMVYGLRTHNLPLVIENMGNVLETVTLKRYPVVEETKLAMEQLRTANAVLMSGSGPTVFGVFMNRKKAQNAYLAMKKRCRETYLVRTI